jgi:hypothetical protein
MRAPPNRSTATVVAPHIAAALHTALRRDGVATRGRTFEGAASTPCEARAASIH